MSHHEGARTVRLPHQARAVPNLRSRLVTDLEERGLTAELVDEAETVVAELVNNAIIHAEPLPDGTIRVHWQVKAGHVEVEVRDGGGGRGPQPHRPSEWATRGRGLRIVRGIAHEWGVQPEENGRTVWASLGGPSRRRRI